MEVNMTTYTCTLCEEPIGDTSMSPPDLSSKIWQHFCSVHMEDGTDARRVFLNWIQRDP
jgi:hypothetical protein